MVSSGGSDQPERPRARHAVPLRLDPAVYDAVARWANDELRSVNAQIELVIRRALDEEGRTPKGIKPIVKRGRPPRDTP